jgi:hypothetical protein
MIKLVDILKEITEGKQVGDLYHFTPLKNIPTILNSQRLNPNDEGQISTSRRPNMNIEIFMDNGFSNRMDNASIARMVLDGNKISNKYIDRDGLFDSVIRNKLEGVYDDIGWQLNLNLFKAKFFNFN